LAKFADPSYNPMITKTGWSAAQLKNGEKPYLETAKGVKVDLITDFPAHNQLSRCHLALTTVGANTAELGALAIPMIILLPTQQLDAMRTWDGLPGLLAQLPGVGSLFAKIINLYMLRKKRLYAWPNVRWCRNCSGIIRGITTRRSGKYGDILVRESRTIRGYPAKIAGSARASRSRG
jgi:lipid-A-disaccharide synthase